MIYSGVVGEEKNSGYAFLKVSTSNISINKSDVFI